MSGGSVGRVRGGELATRINAAADLLEAGTGSADAVRALVERFGCSQRQAYRYVQRAARSGRVQAPSVVTVFTVKLPVELVASVRAHAAASGRTISAVVGQALAEFLARTRREHPRR